MKSKANPDWCTQASNLNTQKRKPLWKIKFEIKFNAREELAFKAKDTVHETVINVRTQLKKVKDLLEDVRQFCQIDREKFKVNLPFKLKGVS